MRITLRMETVDDMVAGYNWTEVVVPRSVRKPFDRRQRARNDPRGREGPCVPYLYNSRLHLTGSESSPGLGR
jgi:hypothetical protein